MNQLDRRLHAARPDLADVALEGRVEAARFVEGELLCVAASAAPVRRSPSHDAMLLTEALRGERVRVFEATSEGWAWVQLKSDKYVGWIPGDCLVDAAAEPTHRVAALRTLVFSKADIKSPPLGALSFGAEVTVVAEEEDRNARYARIDGGGAIVVQHLAPLGAFEHDFVAVAERFMGTPYLWGGKTSFGIDCSGLVQVALSACGIAAPRDTDMQEAAIGEGLPVASTLPPLWRGDLLYWKGHAGIMRDAGTLLHANAHHMAVASEPLSEVLARFERSGIVVSAVRRLGAL